MIEAMIESAMRSAELAEETGLRHDRIILSAKVSRVRDLVDVYRVLATRSDYPLHLGLTEAGLGMKGIVASTAGLADPAGGGDRGHDPCLAHAGARWRARGGGPGRAAGPPVDGPPVVPAPGQRLPGLRPHDLDVLPGDGGADPGPPPRPHAEWQRDASRRRVR